MVAVYAVVIFNVLLASILFLSLPALWRLQYTFRDTALFFDQTTADLEQALAPTPASLQQTRTSLKDSRKALDRLQQRLNLVQAVFRLWRR